jgi:formylglycine-generating enzyme required for sulfatase activity
MSLAESPDGAVELVAARLLRRGEYWIGDDAVATSAPRHLRRFRADAWIEAGYTRWADFETFAAAGGYADERLWRDDVGHPFPTGCRPASVDGRCEAIREATLAGVPQSWQDSGPGPSMPLLGLTWFEAMALSRFFGGRLPFEAEWEAAVIARVVAAGDDVEGRFQEWTGDGYVGRYWRADEAVRGRPWTTGRQVVARGYAIGEPTLAKTARRGVDPAVGSRHRGFRRAWDRDPMGHPSRGGIFGAS